jgi:alpha-beta hydrolase superfamily lysophospholipase
MKKEVFVSYDGKKLACFLWDDVTNPKGVIQIVHGMTSHMQRFKEFGEELNRRGYIAYGDDHRPHGETAGLENLGKAGKNNFSENVRDEIEITKMLKARFRLPVQLFSHSYGSFLAQSYITTDSALIDGLILSGSAYMEIGRASCRERV